MIFEWDENKNRTNTAKHGISFEEAETVFFDENGLFIFDPDHSINEDRFILLGMSEIGRILIVCHCHKITDDRIRIISARKATKHEKVQYEKGAAS